MPGVIPWSFHTHSSFCDGAGTIEDVVQAAIRAGLHDLGISSHAPLPFDTEWNMPLVRLQEYVVQVRELQAQYRDRIAIWLGAELDYIPGDAVRWFRRDEI